MAKEVEAKKATADDSFILRDIRFRDISQGFIWSVATIAVTLLGIYISAAIYTYHETGKLSGIWSNVSIDQRITISVALLSAAFVEYNMFLKNLHKSEHRRIFFWDIILDLFVFCVLLAGIVIIGIHRGHENDAHISLLNSEYIDSIKCGMSSDTAYAFKILKGQIQPIFPTSDKCIVLTCPCKQASNQSIVISSALSLLVRVFITIKNPNE